MAVCIFPRHDKSLFHLFRRIVLYNSRTEAVKTGIIIPAYGNMGIIGKAVFLFHPLPYLFDISQNLIIIPVNIGNMRELVMSNAGKSQV